MKFFALIHNIWRKNKLKFTRSLQQVLTSRKNIERLKKCLLTYLVYNQVCLNLLIDDSQFGFIIKSKKTMFKVCPFLFFTNAFQFQKIPIWAHVAEQYYDFCLIILKAFIWNLRCYMHDSWRIILTIEETLT